MGSQKSTTSSSQTQTATPTGMEDYLNNMQMQYMQSLMGISGQPYNMQTQQPQRGGFLSAITNRLGGQGTQAPQYGDMGIQNPLAGYDSVINQLLSGGQLGGGYQNLYGIGNDMASQMAQESVRGMPAYMQQQGLLDSGTAASAYSRTYGDTLRNVAQFNTQQQGNVLQMGMGGALQRQGLNMGLQEMLGNRLAGLRTVRSSGSQSTTSPMFTGSNIMGGIGGALGTFGMMMNPLTAAGTIIGGAGGLNTGMQTQGGQSFQTWSPYKK